MQQAYIRRMARALSSPPPPTTFPHNPHSSSPTPRSLRARQPPSPPLGAPRPNDGTTIPLAPVSPAATPLPPSRTFGWRALGRRCHRGVGPQWRPPPPGGEGRCPPAEIMSYLPGGALGGRRGGALEACRGGGPAMRGRQERGWWQRKV